MTDRANAGIEQIALEFLEECERGQGWEACKRFCTPDAGFRSQAEPLAEIATLEAYTQWMHGLIAMLPDGDYAVKTLATDRERGIVTVFAVFTGTHSGADGPVPATGRRTQSDYVYILDFAGARIAHLIKVWNAGWAMRQLGWA